jgi:hypothetical protein
VSTINPLVSMQTVKNHQLEVVTAQVSDKLKKVLEAV